MFPNATVATEMSDLLPLSAAFDPDEPKRESVHIERWSEKSPEFYRSI